MDRFWDQRQKTLLFILITCLTIGIIPSWETYCRPCNCFLRFGGSRLANDRPSTRTRLVECETKPYFISLIWHRRLNIDRSKGHTDVLLQTNRSFQIGRYFTDNPFPFCYVLFKQCFFDCFLLALFLFKGLLPWRYSFTKFSWESGESNEFMCRPFFGQSHSTCTEEFSELDFSDFLFCSNSITHSLALFIFSFHLLCVIRITQCFLNCHDLIRK